MHVVVIYSHNICSPATYFRLDQFSHVSQRPAACCNRSTRSSKGPLFQFRQILAPGTDPWSHIAILIVLFLFLFLLLSLLGRPTVLKRLKLRRRFKSH